MTKKILAKVGTYQNAQNETKNDYVKIGVVMSNENGEYLLLDPTVSLSGVLQKQNALAAKENKPQRDMVMGGIFDEQQNQSAPPQQQGYQNQQNPTYQQPQQGYQQPGGFTPR